MPAWWKEDDFEYQEMRSEEYLAHSQVDKDLAELFKQPDGEQQFEDGWLYARRDKSIEKLLETGQISPENFDDIIYIRGGFINGKPKKMYPGQSGIASSSNPKCRPPSLRPSPRAGTDDDGFFAPLLSTSACASTFHPPASHDGEHEQVASQPTRIVANADIPYSRSLFPLPARGSLSSLERVLAFRIKRSTALDASSSSVSKTSHRPP